MKITTAHDARNARQRLTTAEAREARRSLRESENLAIVAANPSVGILMRRGVQVFYAFTAEGYRESKNPRDLISA